MTRLLTDVPTTVLDGEEVPLIAHCDDHPGAKLEVRDMDNGPEWDDGALDKICCHECGEVTDVI